jgi:hypothetical protein
MSKVDTRGLLLVAVWGLLAVPMLVRGSGAETIDVTDCADLVVPGGATAVLQSDVVCETGPYLENGAALDLNGFSILLSGRSGLYCAKTCQIWGPGSIDGAGSTSFGIYVGPGGDTGRGGRLTLSDVNISGVATGVAAPFGNVRVANTTIVATTWGISGVKRADLDTVSISLSESGGYGVDTWPYPGNPGSKLAKGASVKGRNVTLTGCNQGILATRDVRLDGLTHVGAPGAPVGVGVYAERRVTLTNSSVTGSVFRDIVSRRKPKLVGVTCDSSARLEDPFGDGVLLITGDWDSCTND